MTTNQRGNPKGVNTGAKTGVLRSRGRKRGGMLKV